MTEDAKTPSLEEVFQVTNCYSYEVKMVIQVLAPNEDIANAKLDKEGGYISKREVSLVKETPLHKSEGISAAKLASPEKNKKE